jgi:hypothetical protein
LGPTPLRQTKEENYKPKGKNLTIGSAKGGEIDKITDLGKNLRFTRL